MRVFVSLPSAPLSQLGRGGRALSAERRVISQSGYIGTAAFQSLLPGLEVALDKIFE